MGIRILRSCYLGRYIIYGRKTFLNNSDQTLRHLKNKLSTEKACLYKQVSRTTVRFHAVRPEAAGHEALHRNDAVFIHAGTATVVSIAIRGIVASGDVEKLFLRGEVFFHKGDRLVEGQTGGVVRAGLNMNSSNDHNNMNVIWVSPRRRLIIEWGSIKI